MLRYGVMIGLRCLNYARHDAGKSEIAKRRVYGVKVIVKYTVINQKTKSLALKGRTTHCFTNNNSKPIILKNSFPIIDEE